MRLKSYLTLSLVLLLNLITPSYGTSATYYSPKLKGKIMTNGKPYNPNRMTAAHPTIRIGRTIRVKNKKTGKIITVVVTDKCNCSLDLSFAAYKAVGGSIKKGRVNVSVF